MALLGLLIVVAAFQMLQISKLNDRISGMAVAAPAASADDDYAKMMKEHHGIDVNAQKTQSSSPLDNVPNMVGGC